MYISEVARRTGATARAIRLYESLGLLVVPRRGRYRVYEPAHVEFIQLIKHAQAAGVTLAELQAVQRDNNDLDWAALDALLQRKYQQLQQEIADKQRQTVLITRYQQVIADCVARNLARCDPPDEASVSA